MRRASKIDVGISLLAPTYIDNLIIAIYPNTSSGFTTTTYANEEVAVSIFEGVLMQFLEYFNVRI